MNRKYVDSFLKGYSNILQSGYMICNSIVVEMLECSSGLEHAITLRPGLKFRVVHLLLPLILLGYLRLLINGWCLRGDAKGNNNYRI